MNLMAHFNYRFAIAERKGYAKAVSFNIDPSLAGAPLPMHAREARSHGVEGERSERSPLTGKSRDVRAARMQAHRANRRAFEELKPSERRKQRYNAEWWRKKKAAKASLKQQAFALEGES